MLKTSGLGPLRHIKGMRKCRVVLLVGLLIPSAAPLLAQQDPLILFYRPDARGDSDQTVSIFALGNGGNRKLVSIAKGEYFALHVRPGDHAYSWTDAPSRTQQLVINVKAGQQAFLEVRSRGIILAGTGEAPGDFKALRPIDAVRVYDSQVLIPRESVHFGEEPHQASNLPPPTVQQAKTIEQSPLAPQEAIAPPPQSVQPYAVQTKQPDRPQQTSKRQEFDVKIIDRRNSSTRYTYVAPGHSQSVSSGSANCYAYGTRDVNVSCTGSTVTTGTYTPPRVHSYDVQGATLSLQLPDGRVAVVNCDSKYSLKFDYINRRNCRMPLVNEIQAEFDGDNAKLKWPVSLDGKKLESETYKILAVMDQRQ